MSDYFLVHAGEDGVTIEKKTKEQILEFMHESDETSPVVHSKLPKEWWHVNAEGYYIIKGELITPQPVEHITKWDIK